jgi:hypothetical protein
MAFPPTTKFVAYLGAVHTLILMVGLTCEYRTLYACGSGDFLVWVVSAVKLVIILMDALFALTYEIQPIAYFRLITNPIISGLGMLALSQQSGCAHGILHAMCCLHTVVFIIFVVGVIIR